MQTVTLQNPGLIPLEAITTMGVSVKENDNPIGFFGTGLKYALALLLRTGHRVKIWRGTTLHEFTTLTQTVRGKAFDFVAMNGTPLGFTTHLGANWELWQAFRELYSNCLDENGSLSFSSIAPKDDATTIQVTGPQFAQCAADKNKYFLATAPLASTNLAEIHPGASNHLFYRGICVATLPRTAAFTYNILQTLTLTEDRTLKDTSTPAYYIAHALVSSTDVEMIKRAISNIEGYEESLHWSSPGEVFCTTVMALCEACGMASVVPRAIGAAEAWAQREARVLPIALSSREESEVQEALRFLSAIGHQITASVTFTETLGPGVFGMAKRGKIFISRTTLNRGGNFLIGTLLEEQLHITHGFEDESRRFQDFLIDTVVKFAKDAVHASVSTSQPAFTPSPDPNDDIPF